MRLSSLARGVWLGAVVALACLGLVACSAPVDGFDAVTPQGATIGRLFVQILLISGIVFLLVVGILVFALIQFRAGRASGAPRSTVGNATVQVAWTVIPLILFAAIAVPMVRTMQVVGGGKAPELFIRVIGHQWWWEFDYPDQAVVTANELHVPTDTPLRLEITGADVIHSFWVPQFGWKMDAIPGRTTVMDVQVDREGIFEGACTEFCGLEHAWMRIRVVAQPRDQFAAWVAQQRQPAAAPLDAVAKAGEGVFLSNTCVNCHTIRGTGAEGAIGPDLTHLASRAVIGAGVAENSPDKLRAWVSDADAVKPGVLMPPFTSLSDKDVDALVRYLDGLK